MGRAYIISAGGITLANQAVTLVFLNPGTTCSLEILRCWVSQSGTATGAQQRVQIVTQVSAFPTLTSTTPRKKDLLEQASQIIGGIAGAAGTCGTNASAEGAGAKTVLLEDAFNNLNGFLWTPTTEDEIWRMNAGAASGFGLHLPIAPGTLTNWSFGIVFRER